MDVVLNGVACSPPKFVRMIGEIKGRPVSLLDFDVLAHLVGARCATTTWTIPSCPEEKFHYKKEAMEAAEEGELPTQEVEYAPPTAAASIASEIFAKTKALVEQTPDTQLFCCVSKGKTFRHLLHEGYKAKRPPVANPWVRRFRMASYYLATNTIKDAHAEDAETAKFLRKEFPNAIWGFMPWAEADDLISILATTHGIEDCDILSVDKDLLQIGSSMTHPISGEHFPALNPDQIQEWIMYQWLVGDSTDGIHGCPGIGDVKAKAIINGLKDLDDTWSVVEGVYHQMIAAPEAASSEMLLNLRLIRLLIAPDEIKDVFIDDHYTGSHEPITDTIFTEFKRKP